MGFRVEVAGKTDVGCVRSNNEDNFGYDTRYGIYVVCDGMGGQAAGEVASKIGVDTVLNYYRTSVRSGHFPKIGEQVEGLADRANRLGSAIQLANQAVYEAASANAAHSGMGSTLVAVSTDAKGAFFSIGHVGDSRIYLVRNGDIEQLTNDHSLVMEQVRRGLITLAEARVSKMQNIIIKALGSEPSVKPDLDDRMAAPGDVLILCSDGLTRHVPDDAMAEVVSNTPDLRHACQLLIDAARDGGGEDNITCLLLRFTVLPWYKKLLSTVLPGGGSPKWQNSI
ncbi:MAG TPA: Stp1/IreP family PP2C-type Ser/Thr phosphatase [Terriglobales bacterium]|nr:Stp1/IreP family PP2C-type Ser/Thr phosphatase [Terriglobales bacterium]